MTDLAYPEGAFDGRVEMPTERWASSSAGEVMRLPPSRAEMIITERRITMRFAHLEDDGLPPVDTYGSMVYPSAFAHIDYGVPLVRNHDWGEIIGRGAPKVSEREAIIIGELGSDAGGSKAASQMEFLLGVDAKLECSVSMRPSTARIRRGDELSVAERAKFEAAGWLEFGYAIDYADIIEVSWVLAGSVPDTSVSLRSEDAEGGDTPDAEGGEGGDGVDNEGDAGTINEKQARAFAAMQLAIAASAAMEAVK